MQRLLLLDHMPHVSGDRDRPVQVNRLRWRAGKRIGGEFAHEQGLQVDFKQRTGMRWQLGSKVDFVVELQPMEIRTFLLTPDAQRQERRADTAPAA